MRKAVAAAGSSAAVVQVGDRRGTSDEFVGMPVTVLLIGEAVLGPTMVVATYDDTHSN